jgi:7-cyano-7-deazaguanine synthase
LTTGDEPGEEIVMAKKPDVLVLLGGGLDSTALIPFYQDRGAPVHGIHFDYGQPSCTGERHAALAICEHYSVPLSTIALGVSPICHGGEYRGRNALLLFAAASLSPGPNSLAIGIHAGVPYYDSSPAFIHDLNRLFDGYFAGTTRVEAPFITLTKSDVYALTLQAGVPIDMTFSCERRSDAPCGECLSCRDREALHGRS